MPVTNPTIRLFTFDAAWGLPTCGPFGLKLEVCLRMLGIPYERVHEGERRPNPSESVGKRSPLPP
jgi:hypothetical protein